MSNLFPQYDKLRQYIESVKQGSHQEFAEMIRLAIDLGFVTTSELAASLQVGITFIEAWCKGRYRPHPVVRKEAAELIYAKFPN